MGYWIQIFTLHVSCSHLEEELGHMMPDEKFDLEGDDKMEFHYFKIHDHNNDNKLDGLELGMFSSLQLLFSSPEYSFISGGMVLVNTEP